VPVILLMCTSDLRFGADLFDGVGGGAPIVFRRWPDGGACEDVDYLLIWGPPTCALEDFPNLKAVFSLGAGVDHLGDLKALPEHIPVIRFIDPRLTEEMTGYILLNVLRFHRQDLAYRDQEANEVWDHIYPLASGDVRVGIAGAGELGLSAARALKGLGYDVAIWSRGSKDVEGIESFVGLRDLERFLGRTSILVNLLPLTEETRGLWRAETFAMLEDGAFVINAGRGGSLIETDLLAALDRGKLAGAALDVFETEPLPLSHGFWAHPKVVVTPHVASLTHPNSIARQVAANISRLERGDRVEGLVDPVRGY
jgi:glyoxylate/hydroxypyruvate reductase